LTWLFVKMWFKVHRNVNDIRKQIIAFIMKHIIILFTHKSIHNSDRNGIKYWMSYPRWSTFLVVNKQFWSDQSAVDQNETSKRSNGLWSHHLTLIQTLENVQRRAARFVINDYTSRTQGCMTSMLTSLQWQTLEQRRRISRLVMMYKIQHQLVDIDQDLYLRPGDSRTRGQHRFFQERSIMTLRNSFQRTAREWNHLPDTTVGASSKEEFRANLHQQVSHANQCK
jgi:hypothetical protein